MLIKMYYLYINEFKRLYNINSRASALVFIQFIALIIGIILISFLITQTATYFISGTLSLKTIISIAAIIFFVRLSEPR